MNTITITTGTLVMEAELNDSPTARVQPGQHPGPRPGRRSAPGGALARGARRDAGETGAKGQAEA